MTQIADSLAKIQAELTVVCQSCGRNPTDITLIAVTKQRSVAEINQVIEAGIHVIGENRIQEALDKFPDIHPCERHFIGHLQTNKVREVVANFDCVQSVDSVRLAEKLNQECARVGKTLPIFLQVNIAAETTKSGFMVAELTAAVERIKQLPNLQLIGLMVIGPSPDGEISNKSQISKFQAPNKNSAYQESVMRVFREGKKLTEQFDLPSYSAGMSGDWQLAVACGATHLRLGRILFESDS